MTPETSSLDILFQSCCLYGVLTVVDGDDDGDDGDDDDGDDVSSDDDDVDQISIVANLSLRFQLIGRAGLSNSTLTIRYICLL